MTLRRLPQQAIRTPMKPWTWKTPTPELDDSRRHQRRHQDNEEDKSQMDQHRDGWS